MNAVGKDSMGAEIYLMSSCSIDKNTDFIVIVSVGAFGFMGIVPVSKVFPFDLIYLKIRTGNSIRQFVRGNMVDH